MQITFFRDLQKSYMIVTMDTDPLDYQIRMCGENRMEGLLAYEVLIADGRVQLWYDITGMQSFETYQKTKQAGIALFYDLFRALAHVTEVCRRYLVDEDRLSLDTAHIYVDSATEEIRFCFLPEAKLPLHQSFQKLVEYFMKHMEHGPDPSTELIYRIYQITLAEDYSFIEVRKLLEKMQVPACGELRMEERPDAGMQQKPSVPRTDDSSTDLDPEKQAHTAKIGQLAQQIHLWLEQVREWYGEKRQRKDKKEQEKLQVVFEPEEEPEREQTMYLGDRIPSERTGMLLVYQGAETDRNLSVEKFPYLIGCRKGADGCIERNGISRLHAQITQEADGCYIEDLNSKNGTRINGVLLNYQEKVRLSPGMEIAFAAEKYIFYEKEIQCVDIAK